MKILAVVNVKWLLDIGRVRKDLFLLGCLKMSVVEVRVTIGQSLVLANDSTTASVTASHSQCVCASAGRQVLPIVVPLSFFGKGVFGKVVVISACLCAAEPLSAVAIVAGRKGNLIFLSRYHG